MARYNQWQNERLLAACDTLDADILTEDRGLFFKSILATFDHILNVDRTLIKKTVTGSVPLFDPNQRQTESYEAFKQARVEQDAEITRLCEGQDPAWFEGEIPREVIDLGRICHFPRWFYLTQMFNHQTHHRSQVTSELHRMGMDYGNTDMPFNPLTPY